MCRSAGIGTKSLVQALSNKKLSAFLTIGQWGGVALEDLPKPYH
jgi:hypothetical protein